MKSLVLTAFSFFIACSAFGQQIIETRLFLGDGSAVFDKSGDKITVTVKMRPQVVKSDGTAEPAQKFQLSARIGVAESFGNGPEFFTLETAQSQSTELIADGSFVSATFVFERKDLPSENRNPCVQLLAMAGRLQTPVLVCGK